MHGGPRWSLLGPEREARTARRHGEASLRMARKRSPEWEDEVASRRERNQEHMAVHCSLETANQIAARRERDQQRSAERRSEDNHHAVWCPEGKRARADGRSPGRWACCFCWSFDWLIDDHWYILILYGHTSFHTSFASRGVFAITFLLFTTCLTTCTFLERYFDREAYSVIKNQETK